MTALPPPHHTEVPVGGVLVAELTSYLPDRMVVRLDLDLEADR